MTTDTLSRIITAAPGIRAELWQAEHADTIEQLATAIAERDIARADREAAEQAAETFERASAELRTERDAAHAEIAELHKCADLDREILNEMRTERDDLRAEADKLRARPVVTEAALRLAITSRRTGEDGPRIGTPASIYAQLTEGGAVTLPAPGPDAAEFLIDKMRSYGWHLAGPEAAPDLRRAIAAMPKAPPPAVAPGPVLAGVSIEELEREYLDAWVTAPLLTGSGRAGIEAVVARLGASLVAPVDPEAVAKAYHDDDDGPGEVGGWCRLSRGDRAAAALSMRRILKAAGIPVTPEAGK